MEGKDSAGIAGDGVGFEGFVIVSEGVRAGKFGDDGAGGLAETGLGDA